MSTTYTTNYHLGKQEDTSDNFNMSVITENMDIIDTALSGKQATLTTTQLSAVNSGIDSTKVAQIETNKNNILLKANTSDVNTATTNLQAQINNLITPITQDAEVQNARVGVDGDSYTTLKERLDSENSSLKDDLAQLKEDVGIYTVTEIPYDGTNEASYSSTGADDRIAIIPITLQKGNITKITIGYNAQGQTKFYHIDKDNKLKAVISPPDYVGKNTEVSVSISVEDGDKLGVLDKNLSGGKIRFKEDSTLQDFIYVTGISEYDVGDTLAVSTSGGAHPIWFVKITEDIGHNDIAEIKSDVDTLLSKNNIGTGKILCIGDSLTAGVYSNTGTSVPQEKNYPYFMHDIIENTSINAGYPGYSTKMVWNQKITSIDFTNVSIIIIMLGTNGGLTDTLDTDVTPYTDYEDYADTQTGCYCKIIEYCMEQAPDAALFLCTTPFFDKNKVPQFDPPTTPRANDVIPKIATKYKLPIIDVREKMGINEKNTLYYQEGDGLHGTEKFYRRLGHLIGAEVKSNAPFVF